VLNHQNAEQPNKAKQKGGGGADDAHSLRNLQIFSPSVNRRRPIIFETDHHHYVSPHLLISSRMSRTQAVSTASPSGRDIPLFDDTRTAIVALHCLQLQIWDVNQ
jgi:hypothetical protein